VNFSETSALSSDGESKENFVRITIKDSGKGVKEDELSLITQKYFRGSNSKETSGYGLGMYLVKRYMEMQLGGMEYYNDNGFTVQLLLKKV
jgi:signal transduction histidine kinase